MKNKVIIFIILTVLIMLLPINIFAGYSGINTDITITGASSSKEYTESILGTLQAIGSGASVITLVIIGIRYMVSSVEEKASMKGVIGYWCVGAILVFATVNITSIMYEIISSINME